MLEPRLSHNRDEVQRLGVLTGSVGVAATTRCGSEDALTSGITVEEEKVRVLDAEGVRVAQLEAEAEGRRQVVCIHQGCVHRPRGYRVAVVSEPGQDLDGFVRPVTDSGSRTPGVAQASVKIAESADPCPPRWLETARFTGATQTLSFEYAPMRVVRRNPDLKGGVGLIAKTRANNVGQTLVNVNSFGRERERILECAVQVTASAEVRLRQVGEP